MLTSIYIICILLKKFVDNKFKKEELVDIITIFIMYFVFVFPISTLIHEVSHVLAVKAFGVHVYKIKLFNLDLSSPWKIVLSYVMMISARRAAGYVIHHETTLIKSLVIGVMGGLGVFLSSTTLLVFLPLKTSGHLSSIFQLLLVFNCLVGLIEAVIELVCVGVEHFQSSRAQKPV